MIAGRQHEARRLIEQNFGHGQSPCDLRDLQRFRSKVRNRAEGPPTQGRSERVSNRRFTKASIHLQLQRSNDFTESRSIRRKHAALLCELSISPLSNLRNDKVDLSLQEMQHFPAPTGTSFYSEPSGHRARGTLLCPHA